MNFEEKMFLYCNILSMIICIVGMVDCLYFYFKSKRWYHMGLLLEPLISLFRYKRLVVHRSDLLYDMEDGDDVHDTTPIKYVEHFDTLNVLISKGTTI